MSVSYFRLILLSSLLFLFVGCGGGSDPAPADCVDDCPPSNQIDTDSDGVIDAEDAFPNDPSETQDTDRDGVGDNGDAFPNDPTETKDTDGDGIGDNADGVIFGPGTSGIFLLDSEIEDNRIFVSSIQVNDDNGSAVANLTKQDFILTQNNDDLNNEDFFYVDPLTDFSYVFQTALALDISTSIDLEELESVKQAAKEVVNNLSVDQQLAIYTFSSEVNLIQNYTDDKQALLNAIDTITRGSSSTALYDASVAALESFNNNFSAFNVSVAGAAIIVTDGEDTAETTGIEEVKLAAKNKALFFIPVGDEADVDTLKQVAGSTNVVAVDSFSALSDQVALFRDAVISQSKGRYIVSYAPSARSGEINLTIALASDADKSVTSTFSPEGFDNAEPTLRLKGLNGVDQNIILGSPVTLSAETLFSNDTADFTWEITSDNNLVQIQETGENNQRQITYSVNALGGSDATITLSVADNNWPDRPSAKIERQLIIKPAYSDGSLTDLDQDGIGDNTDTDRDGDGVENGNDSFPDDATEITDSDGDGIGDNADAYPNDPDRSEIASDAPDTDGDGVPDAVDDFPNDATETVDTDGDGVGDNSDTFPNDATETADTDADGVGDNADAYPNDPTRSEIDPSEVDTDGDGVVDINDAFPNDATETADTDGDGVGDNADAYPNDSTRSEIDSNEIDTDGDGVSDGNDAFPNDATETADTDGDGVGDNADAYPNDPARSEIDPSEIDTDGDGVSDGNDAFPNDATETTDTDGDGVGDNADAFPVDDTETTDSDGDGVGDNSDDFPNDETEQVDTDGDGVGDNADDFPNDPMRQSADLALSLLSEGTENNSVVVGSIQVLKETGEPVTNLDRDDFVLTEDGNPLGSEDFYYVDKLTDFTFTFKTVLALDVSASINLQELEEVKQAARDVVNNLVEGQELAILSFSSTVKTESVFTTNKESLLQSINNIGRGSSSTNLYGASITALNSFSDNFSAFDSSTAGAAIIVTDGNDTSDLNTINDVISAKGTKELFYVPVGSDTDQQTLETIVGANNVFSIDSYTELASQIASLRDGILEKAKARYIVFYAPSGRSGDRELTIALARNTDEEVAINFNPSGFNDVRATVRLKGLDGANRNEVPESPSVIIAETLFSNDSANYTWQIYDDSEKVGIEVLGNSDRVSIQYDATNTVDFNNVRIQVTDNNWPGVSSADLTQSLVLVQSYADGSTTDLDGDGIGDNSDSDLDGDGVFNLIDVFPNDPTESVDTDNDGIGDNADAFPTDSTETADTDEDGVGDNADAFPNDASESLDSDTDGVGDNADCAPNNAAYSIDSDADSVCNELDAVITYFKSNLFRTESPRGLIRKAALYANIDGGAYGDRTSVNSYSLYVASSNTSSIDSDADGIVDSAIAWVEKAPFDPDASIAYDSRSDFNQGTSLSFNIGFVPEASDDFPLNTPFDEIIMVIFNEQDQQQDLKRINISNNSFDQLRDRDGDGFNDSIDVFPFDENESLDTDRDGVGDNADGCPNDRTSTADDNDNGICDVEEVTFAFVGYEELDVNGNGLLYWWFSANRSDIKSYTLSISYEGSEGFVVIADKISYDSTIDSFVLTYLPTAPQDIPEGTRPQNFKVEAFDSEDTLIGSAEADVSENAFPQLIDTDGDGFNDLLDCAPENAEINSDRDGDNVCDVNDAFPDDATESVDNDGDSVGDNADCAPEDSSINSDRDGDSVCDIFDAFPDDSTETIDSDGDTVGDNADCAPNDPNDTLDSDGDSICDNADAFPSDPTETLDSDQDGVGDNTDMNPGLKDTALTIEIDNEVLYWTSSNTEDIDEYRLKKGGNTFANIDILSSQSYDFTGIFNYLTDFNDEISLLAIAEDGSVLGTSNAISLLPEYFPHIADNATYIKKSSSYNGPSFSTHGEQVAISDDGNTMISAYTTGGVSFYSFNGSEWVEDDFKDGSSFLPDTPLNQGLSGKLVSSVGSNGIALSGNGQIAAVAGRAFLGSIGRESNLEEYVAIFRNDGNGVWSFEQLIISPASDATIPSTNNFTNQFGASLSLTTDGETLVIGTPLEHSNSSSINGVENNQGACNSGAVFVYERPIPSDQVLNEADWAKQAFIKASDVIETPGPVTCTSYDDNARFGNSLDISGNGDLLVVGTYGAGGDVGKFYTFRKNTSGEWDESWSFSPDDSFTKISKIDVAKDGSSFLVRNARYTSLYDYSVYHYKEGISCSENDYSLECQANIPGTNWLRARFNVRTIGTSAGWNISARSYGDAALADGGLTLAIGDTINSINARGLVISSSDESLPRSGAVIMYRYLPETNEYVQDRIIKSTNPDADDKFGSSIALAQTARLPDASLPTVTGSQTIVISSAFEDGGGTGINPDQSDNSNPNSGAIYIYRAE